jgi:hypothetical protein
LQRLVSATYKDTNKFPKVVAARRIENSSSWNIYAAFRRKLQDQLRASAKLRYVSAEALCSRGQDDRPQLVLTHEELHEEFVEESISISNLDDTLNEYLLWHGTARESAEAIVRREFETSGASGERARSKRFGNGTYFAEDSTKALTYAPAENGVQCVLLCRVLCGDMLYTEESLDAQADERRLKSGKHSVLAHPQRRHAREFVVSEACQVYPEYLLEVRVEAAELPEVPPPSTRPTDLEDDVELAEPDLALGEFYF